MTRVKCKKCQKVYEHGIGMAILSPHVGPFHLVKCRACGKRIWANLYSSVKEPITWPPEANKQEQAEKPQLSEEELEKRQIEDSKYERP